MPKTLAHLSDLHLGRSAGTERTTRRLCDQLLQAEVDHVVVTGDITHRGRRADLERFFDIFDAFERTRRLTVIPGNHDRNGEGAGSDLMQGRRVATVVRPGLHLVLVDSTADHNRSVIACHGELLASMLEEIDLALLAAAPGALVAICVHHHLLPLPLETLGEWFADSVGWPNAEELARGRELVERVRGRCDLVLHGHRHVPTEFRFFDGEARPVTIYNAGSSSELARARVFTHDDGRLAAPPAWLGAQEPAPPVTRPRASILFPAASGRV